MRLCTLAASVFIAGTAAAQSPYAVTAAGDTLRGQIELRDPLIGKSFVEVDGERHEIEAFRELHINGETLAVVDGRGLATLVRPGRVSFYTRTSTSFTPGVALSGPGVGPAAPPMTAVSTEVGYVRVGDGPLLDATYRNLSDALGDDPESLRHLRQYQTLGTVQAVATVASLAVLGGGAVQMFSGVEEGETPELNALVIAGAVSASVSTFLFPQLRSRALRTAIDTYNE